MDISPPDPAPPQARDSRTALGEFIRLHRARLVPQAAGLAGGGRRRTPGLRREELAQLCCVSATWITWLEQGRQVAASAGTLARLAQALQLTAAERAYLFDLAGRPDPVEPAPPTKAVDAVLRSVHAIRSPAYVLDQRWDVVAANAQAHDLFLGWGRDGGRTIDAPRQPNLLEFLFLAPESRRLIEDWETRSKRLVAEFRADCARRVEAEPVRELIADLARRSPEFARLWSLRDVSEREGGERRFHHPVRGRLVFGQVTLKPAVRSEYKLVMLLPAGDGFSRAAPSA